MNNVERIGMWKQVAQTRGAKNHSDTTRRGRRERTDGNTNNVYHMNSKAQKRGVKSRSRTGNLWGKHCRNMHSKKVPGDNEWCGQPREIQKGYLSSGIYN